MLETTVTKEKVQEEAERLYGLFKDRIPDMTLETCRFYAPWVSEINRLKKQQNAVILAHTYVQPLVLFGVADFVGDSLFLSKKAVETSAATIVFAGVRFMAETAKILNPNKTVLLPSIEAGCSLADSITPADVRALRREHPGAWVVSYVNTSVEVKAESDVCCTSANMLQVVEAVPTDDVIFIPDKFMAENLRPLTKKTVHSWDGTCVVHENFGQEQIRGVRESYPDIRVLVHPEAPAGVTRLADFVGSTEAMLNYAKQSQDRRFMFVTECGLSDRARVELPEKEFFGSCLLCPYMKKNHLESIYRVMVEPARDQVIEIEEETRSRAYRAVDNMFKLTVKR